MNYRIAKKDLLLVRDPSSYKGDYGKTLIIGGSFRYPNAPYLASLGAIYGGTGYLAMCVPDIIYAPIVARSYPASIFEHYELERIDLDHYESALYGNGIEEGEEEKKRLHWLLTHYHGCLTLDGGAISILAHDLDLLSCCAPKEIILTPHIGEARRLVSAFDPNEENAVEATLAHLAAHFHIGIFLKGCPRSAFFAKDGSVHRGEPFFTPVLAKAGSGDIYAGILASLLSYGTTKYGVKDLALLADFLLHEKAEEFAEKHPQIGSYTAADVFK